MCSEVILALWSFAGLTWWIIAWRLVNTDRSRKSVPPDGSARQTISVFKPLPLLGGKGLGGFEPGLKSFVAQLDANDDLLLGVHEADRALVAPFLKKLRADYPGARLRVVYRSAPDEAANPKIAWQRYLAQHAEGELWLWSDADIVAPADFLQSARAAFLKSGSKMMTFPYIVRDIPLRPALLEALFVNVDFYPGVLLLRRFGPVDFGLGAAMLFRRDDFIRAVDWDEIGSRLADDFFLGQKLQPVSIGAITLTTLPRLATWGDAFLHDLRWSKTIRWNRPVGFFARILVMPVLGWLMAVAIHPTHFFIWIGLLGMIQADVLAATAICRETGCRMKSMDILRLEIWSLWRILLWFLSWMPGAVAWSGRTWRSPEAEIDTEINLTTT
jgi:ceramide glucosyltransferase